ncbi:MAG: hypothetical protein ACKVS6_05210 [Planctomycetota bacterium]
MNLSIPLSAIAILPFLFLPQGPPQGGGNHGGRQHQGNQDPRGGGDRKMQLLKIRDQLRHQAGELHRQADEIDQILRSPEFNHQGPQNHNDPRNDGRFAPGRPGPDFNNRGNFNNNDGRNPEERRGEMNDRGPRPPFPGGRRGPMNGFGPPRPGEGRPPMDGRGEGPPRDPNDSRPAPPHIGR